MNNDDDAERADFSTVLVVARTGQEHAIRGTMRSSDGRTKARRGASMADMKTTGFLFASSVLMTCVLSATPLSGVRQAGRSAPPSTTPPQALDLTALLGSGTLRAVNRDVTKLAGSPNAVHVSERPDNGVIWIQGTDFSQGTLDVDVRGRDVLQRSFLGIAFHGKSDTAYECVYVRPFNFRAKEPDRHQHAVQYMMRSEEHTSEL